VTAHRERSALAGAVTIATVWFPRWADPGFRKTGKAIGAPSRRWKKRRLRFLRPAIHNSAAGDQAAPSA